MCVTATPFHSVSFRFVFVSRSIDSGMPAKTAALASLQTTLTEVMVRTTVKAICGFVHIVAAFVGELCLTMRKKKMTKSTLQRLVS